MEKLRLPLLIFIVFFLSCPVCSAQTPLSSWISLRSDATHSVKELIRSEVNKREGFSTYQEERANLTAVEEEKDRQDSAYKKAIAEANREFKQAKRRRDDLTSQFQAASIEYEDQLKNINTIKEGIGNLDNQIERYSQDIKTQQASLKKWLQTEKQGEAIVAVIFTRGFRDSAHALESEADKKSGPLIAQYMGTYIQSHSKVIDSVLSSDFIRAVEEGTAKWNNEEPLRIELAKGNKGTTYLRVKRYELFPFQAPRTGRVAADSGSENIKAAVITSPKDLGNFLAANGYSAAQYDLERIENKIRETQQANVQAEASLQEQVKSFQDRINSLQDRIGDAQSEKQMQLALLKRKDEPFKKASQDRDHLLKQKEEAERLFQESQKSLHDIRRIRETIIIKTALAAARGSQTPADASAEAIIDKLEEVRNDAKMQHSTSTTEVTNFQVTAESSLQAVTEARITAARLISFINEGDSVRVKMAFRIRTVLKEEDEKTVQEPPPTEAAEPASETPKDRKPLISYIPDLFKADKKDDKPADEPSAPAVKRNPNALASAEGKEVLFELIKAGYSGKELSVFVDLTNLTQDEYREIALYDENYRWTKSKMTDASGREYQVSQVVFWKGKQKQTMYEAGYRGASLEGRSTQTAQFVFKNVPANMREINKFTLHPFVYFRKVFSWSWEEFNFAFQNVRIER
ncbi:MAG: hypothetical protein JXA41_09040 [Deltaproteobacteria bacterium]|nr:hypothetical protein [Deltaproteobacteria bacterium]